MLTPDVIPVETEVLVIGGGLGGCMAAIRASDLGVQVTLVDKANTLASGCAASGIDHTWGYIPPVHEKMGYTLDDMVEDHRQGTAYGFFRKDLFYLVAGSMYDRVLDLEKFGLRFRYEDSQVPGQFRIVSQFHSVPSSFNFDGAPLKLKLTHQVKRRKVKIANRVQITDLLVTDGQVSGAVGVGTRTGDIYFFKAKAVVLTSGRANRLGRNLGGFDFNTRMPSSLSGDGMSMASRAGLPLINMEFLSGRHLAASGSYSPNLGDPRGSVQPAARIIDWQGKVLVPRTHFYDWANLGRERWTPETRRRWVEERLRARTGAQRQMISEHDRGGGPFYLDFAEASDAEIAYIQWSIKNEGKGTQFMRYFQGEEGAHLRNNKLEYAAYWPRELAGSAAAGLWVDQDLETDIRNFFAAGDAVGGLPWAASSGAFAGGWYAGEMAAKRVKEQRSWLPAEAETVEARKSSCSDILNRARGVYWREVETAVQSVVDFYCGDVRSESLLKRGLERLEDARNAQLKADNPHELARSLDVQSIIDTAELVLHSSIARTESRIVPVEFHRAEFPEKNDEDWLCFLAIQKRNGAFTFSKKPVS